MTLTTENMNAYLTKIWISLEVIFFLVLIWEPNSVNFFFFFVLFILGLGFVSVYKRKNRSDVLCKFSTNRQSGQAPFLSQWDTVSASASISFHLINSFFSLYFFSLSGIDLMETVSLLLACFFSLSKQTRAYFVITSSTLSNINFLVIIIRNPINLMS